MVGSVVCPSNTQAQCCNFNKLLNFLSNTQMYVMDVWCHITLSWELP